MMNKIKTAVITCQSEGLIPQFYTHLRGTLHFLLTVHRNIVRQQAFLLIQGQGHAKEKIPGCQVWQFKQTAGGRLNIRMSFYKYRDSHVKDKTVSRPSYLKRGNPHTWERRSLYWDGALNQIKTNFSKQSTKHHGLSRQVVHNNRENVLQELCIFTTCITKSLKWANCQL